MPTFSPALFTTMIAALDAAMDTVPSEKATTGIEAYLAECIFRTAAEGVTSYEGFVGAVAKQLPTIISMFL